MPHLPFERRLRARNPRNEVLHGAYDRRQIDAPFVVAHELPHGGEVEDRDLHLEWPDGGSAFGKRPDEASRPKLPESAAGRSPDDVPGGGGIGTWVERPEARSTACSRMGRISSRTPSRTARVLPGS